MQENIRVPMRDGITLAVDVYAPKQGGPYPVLLSLSPYAKDIQQNPPQWSHAIESGATGFYVSHGYIHVIAQGRGCGLSQGQWKWFDEKERTDGYDLIEWIASQPWCDGNVGMIGDSYWSWSQYFAAAAQPPHLRCICQCDATTDLYRDAAFPGGIFNAAFMTDWIAYQTAMSAWPGEVEGKEPPMNTHFEIANHPVDGPWWRERSAITYIDQIRVPVMSIAPQGGQMHFRGQLQGFTQIKAPKKLLVVPPTGFWSHVRYLTHPELNAQMLRWFDHWLKGIDTGLMEEPPVKLEIRTGGSTERYPFRSENEWPLARTQWTKYYLQIEREPSADPHAAEGTFALNPPAKAAKLSYSASGVTKAGVASGSSLSTTHGNVGRSGVSFETAVMTEDMEITGPMAMKLWVSSTSEDMDIFITLRNIGPNNEDICEVGQHGQPVPCLTKGWLRASHRKLDAAKSLPYRPYHAHNERLWLKKDEPVECDIEVWPTSIVIKKGHKLRIDVQPRDGVGSAPYTHYHAEYNAGATNTIYAGGDKPSHILLPIIPKK